MRLLLCATLASTLLTAASLAQQPASAPAQDHSHHPSTHGDGPDGLITIPLHRPSHSFNRPHNDKGSPFDFFGVDVTITDDPEGILERLLAHMADFDRLGRIKEVVSAKYSGLADGPPPILRKRTISHDQRKRQETASGEQSSTSASVASSSALPTTALDSSSTYISASSANSAISTSAGSGYASASTSLPPPSSSVQPSASVTPSAPLNCPTDNAAQPMHRRRADPKIGRTDLKGYTVSHEDIDFMGSVSVGSPPQVFDLIFDTGSSDMWIQGTACNNCSRGTRFDVRNSSSACNLQKEFDIQYGIGSTEGDLYTDKVTVGGRTVNQQVFAVADNMSGDWESQPASGLLGFGFSSSGQSGAPNFLANLVSSGSLPSNLFAFAFGRAADGTQDTNSTLTLGGYDAHKFAGELAWHNVSDPRWYWALQMDGIALGAGQSALNGTKKIGIIDTGTTLISAPKADVDAFWATVPNASYVPKGGYWTYPCDQAVNATLTFGGIAYPIADKDLNFGLTNAFSERCVGAITEANTAGYWIIGLTFLKSYYSVFDPVNYKIGFGIPTY